MSHDVEQAHTDLTGHVALVTGGGRGIGRACAQALAAAGAAVAVVARSVDQITETAATITARGQRALALAVDVSDRGAVAQMVREVEDRLGPVDLLLIMPGFSTRWARSRKSTPRSGGAASKSTCGVHSCVPERSCPACSPGVAVGSSMSPV